MPKSNNTLDENNLDSLDDDTAVSTQDLEFKDETESNYLQFRTICDYLEGCQRSKLVSLKELRLDRLSEFEFRKICDFLSQCKELHKLDLSYNRLGTFNAIKFQELGKALSQCKMLHFIDLSCNNLGTLGKDSFKALCDILTQCKKLSILDLTENELDRLDKIKFKAFLHSVSKSKKLRFLNLDTNELGSLGDRKFQEFCYAISQCKKLSNLDLANNNLSELSAPSFQALGNALLKRKNFEKLNLSYNAISNLDNNNFQALCEAVSKCKILNLNLTQNGFNTFDDIKFQVFCDFLSQFKLHELDLSSNGLSTLDDVKFQTFCDSLSQCKMLHFLDLSDNNLCALNEVKFKKLGGALLQCPDFESLNLSENNIGVLNSDNFQALQNALSWINVTGIDKLTDENKQILQIINDRNQKFIQNIKIALNTALPEISDNLQNIVIDYMFPAALAEKIKKNEKLILKLQTDLRDHNETHVWGNNSTSVSRIVANEQKPSYFSDETVPYDYSSSTSNKVSISSEKISINLIKKNYKLKDGSFFNRIVIVPNQHLIGKKIAKQALHDIEKEAFNTVFDIFSQTSEKIIFVDTFMREESGINNYKIKMDPKNRCPEVNTVCIFKNFDKSYIFIDRINLPPNNFLIDLINDLTGKSIEIINFETFKERDRSHISSIIRPIAGRQYDTRAGMFFGLLGIISVLIYNSIKAVDFLFQLKKKSDKIVVGVADQNSKVDFHHVMGVSTLSIVDSFSQSISGEQIYSRIEAGKHYTAFRMEVDYNNIELIKSYLRQKTPIDFIEKYNQPVLTWAHNNPQISKFFKRQTSELEKQNNVKKLLKVCKKLKDFGSFYKECFTLCDAELNDDDTIYLVKILNKDRDLKEFVRKNNSTLGDHAIYLEKILNRDKNIKELVLKGNAIRDKGAEELAKVKDLIFLDLTDNFVGPVGAVSLASGNLKALELSANRTLGNEGAIALSKSKTLRKLVLDYCEIGDTGACEIFNNYFLEELSMRGNNIKNFGINNIRNNKKLSIIDLSENNIGPDGAKSIAFNTHLKKVKLSSNVLGNEGAKQLASNESIEELNLSENGIDEHGFLYLCMNNTIQELSLFSNKICFSVDEPLLYQSSKLTSINLGYNKIKDIQSKKRLKSLITAFPKLKTLSLVHNEINQKETFIFFEQIKKNNPSLNVDIGQQVISGKLHGLKLF